MSIILGRSSRNVAFCPLENECSLTLRSSVGVLKYIVRSKLTPYSILGYLFDRSCCVTPIVSVPPTETDISV